MVLTTFGNSCVGNKLTIQNSELVKSYTSRNIVGPTNRVSLSSNHFAPILLGDENFVLKFFVKARGPSKVSSYLLTKI